MFYVLLLFDVRIHELTHQQKEFLKRILDVEELPEEEDVASFLSSKGFTLYECVGCGKLVFHDNYEFWNLSECCDDNSKLTKEGLLCEVCYSRSPENLKDWILFKPSWVKHVDFKRGV
ncbi:hypothetical protein HRbin13_00195 [bacterium HR13]|nr:hypothetical protein HRbin13_00195 [bacterium HR13]